MTTVEIISSLDADFDGSLWKRVKRVKHVKQKRIPRWARMFYGNV